MKLARHRTALNLLLATTLMAVIGTCRSLDDRVSWQAIIHRIETGDTYGGGSGKDVPITAELIQKLRPGIDSEEDVKRLFPGRSPTQKTFKPYLPVYLKDGVLKIERRLSWSYVPVSCESYEIRGRQIESCAWSDRISLVAHFKSGILQFYTVVHDHRTENDSIVTGDLQELSMIPAHGKELDCASQLYEIQAYGVTDIVSHIGLYKCPWYEDFKNGKLTKQKPEIRHNQYCEHLH
tara:strand:+ start:3215 stop:3922 length:708 start_codon:yes stop_codon:yes gene_type:complete